jgi:predicted DNA-binding transcriptional regulator YafY
MPMQEDPVVKMFRGIKRVDFNITIDLENKIPRIDFIEMMEDSYETSIIDFLADEITDSIISNPDNIRNMIKDKIRQTVSDYSKPAKVKVTKPAVKSKAKEYIRVKK